MLYSFQGSVYLIGPDPVDIVEYDDYCKLHHNGTTLFIKSEEEFNQVASALLRWANDSTEMSFVLESDLSLQFWTSAIYVKQVISEFLVFFNPRV